MTDLKRRVKRKGFGLILIFLLLGFFACAFSSRAAIRKEFNYQGKLTDSTGTNVTDGAYDVVFKIYTQAGGGAAVWTESWTAAALFSDSVTTVTDNGCGSGIDGIDYTNQTNETSLKAGQTLWNATTGQSAVIESVNNASNYVCIYNPQTNWTSGDTITNRIYVKNGLFSAMVGSVTDLTLDFTADTYYLGVTVGTDSEMIPRKKIGSVPQAWNANNLVGNGYIDIDNTAATQDAASINYNPASGTYAALSLTYGNGGGTGDVLTLVQNGTGDIVDFFDGATSVFKIADGGNVTMNALTFQQNAVNPVLKGSLIDGVHMERATGVHVVGKYAYVAAMGSGSLSVIDISNPTNPVLVGYLADGTYMNGATSIYVSGRYAYITGASNSALVVIDISNPAAPVLTGYIVDGVNLYYPSSVYVSGKYAYVTSYDGASFASIDISNPAAPVLTGSVIDMTYLFGSQSVYVSGKYAYVAGGENNALAIIDISNPASPGIVGHLIDATYMSFPSSVYVSGKYAYVAGAYSNSLAVVDISNPASPSLVGHLTDATYMNMAATVYVSGKYAYVGGYTSYSLAVVDISNPVLPSLSGHLTDATYLNGPRPVYVSGKYAYVTGGEGNSIAVIDVSGFDIPTANIGDLSVSTIDVTDNVTIANNLYVGNGLNVGTGGIYSSGEIFGYAASTKAALTIAQTGTGDIVDFKDGTTSVFKIADGGNITMNALTFQQNMLNPVHKGALFDTAGTILYGARSVVVQGKYAYVATRDENGVEIIDISNPASPTHVGSIVDDGTTALSSARAIAVSGSYAYVASYSDNGVEVLDISNPAAPTHVAAVYDDAEKELLGAYALTISGKYLFVAGFDDDGIEILDISNPAAPTHVGSFEDTDDANAELDGPYHIHIQGKYAYVAGNVDDGIEILDISNPAAPTHVGSFEDTDNAAAELDGVYCVYVSGRYAYAVSRDDSGMEILDVSNPANPTHVGSITDDTTTALSGASFVQVSGKYAYVVSITDMGLEVIDVSNPATPTHAGAIFDDANTALNGPRSLYVVGKYIYVASYPDHGLEVLEISGFDLPSANIGDLSVSTIDVTDNANIANDLHVGNSLNVGPGGIYSAGIVGIYANSTSTALTVNQSGTGALMDIMDTGVSIFKVGQATIEMTRPLDLQAEGDVAVSYDLNFLNLGGASINSSGALIILVGGSTSSDDLTLTTGGTGDVIVDIASSTIGFKIIGAESKIFSVDPNGNVIIGGVDSKDADLSVKRNISTLGGNLTLSALSTPSGVTIAPIGTAGSTTYGYRISAINGNGETLAASTATTTTGNATLSSTNYNRISWNAVSGATGYKVYGRTSGSELLIATVNSPTLYYNDTGTVTPSGALPTLNTTGGNDITYASANGPKRSMMLVPGSAEAPNTNPAALTKVSGTNHTYYVLDYDAATDESIFWNWEMPDSYDGGKIDITYYWEAAASSGDVVWCFQSGGAAANSAEDIDITLSSAVCETDTAQGNANDLASVTESQATSNFSPGEYVAFKVYRDADSGSDTMTGDARLVKVKIEYSVDSESD